MARFFFFLGHEEFQPEKIVQLSQNIEAAGFDGVAISEHFHPWVNDKGAAGFAFSTLGAIAQATKKINLMTTVTSPLFRFHPALIAQAAATIDRLSNGRFELGIGTGETLNEKPLGYPFPKYRERAKRISEALGIIQRLFAGEKLTFEGKYYQTNRAKLYSPPIHHIPIYLAAAGPKSAALAGEKTDGVITSVKNPADTIEKVIAPTREAAKKIGKLKPQVIAGSWTVLAQDKDEAWKALEAWRGLRAPSKTTAVDPQQLREEADSLPKEDVLGKFARSKSIEDIVSINEPLIKRLEPDTIVFQIASINIEETIKIVGEKVLPKLKNL